MSRFRVFRAVELPGNPEPEPPHDVRLSQQQTWEEHVAFAPKSVTVAIAVPQDVTPALVQSQSGTDTNTTDWSAHIKDLVASSIPASVTTRINVESYPRGIDRAAATATTGSIASEQSWTSWGIATGSLVALAVLTGWGGLRWHQTRLDKTVQAGLHRECAGQDLGCNSERSAGSGEYSRELVRIERSAARGRAPHLAQATISGFEDLRRLAPASLQPVLGAVESRLWAPALRGASRELCERILTHMPARAAMLLRDEIEYPGPVRLGDVESAQQEILEVVRRLDHTGDLVLEDQEEVFRE